MIRNIILPVIIILFLGAGVFAAETDSSLTKIESQDYFFKISLSRKEAILSIAGRDSIETRALESKNIKKTVDEIDINGVRFLTKEGFYIDGKLYPLDSIDRVRLEIYGDGKSDIYFLRKPSATEKRFRARRQNADFNSGKYIHHGRPLCAGVGRKFLVGYSNRR